jgi:MscS family membrane protein
VDFSNSIPLINNLPLEIRVGIVRIVAAIAIFIIFWLLRHLVSRVLLRPLHDRFANDQNKTDEQIVTAIEHFSSYAVIALAIYVAIAILAFSDGTAAFFSTLATTFVVIAIFRLLFDLGRLVMTDSDRLEKLTKIKLEARVLPFIESLFRIFVVVFALMTIAQIWSLNLTGIVAGLGLVGLAVSLAAKEVLDDVVGFMLILANDVFRKDEYIISPKGQGTVEHIGLLATRLRAPDQSLVIVPNQALTSDAVTNWSRLEKRWFNFNIGITYQASVDQVEQVVDRVRKMLKAREKVDADSIVVMFTEYTGSALNILVRCYVKIGDWTEAQAERQAVNLEIKKICGELGLNIAYDTRSLFIENIQPEWFAGAHLSQNGNHDGNGNGSADGNGERGEVPAEASPGGDDDQVNEKK